MQNVEKWLRNKKFVVIDYANVANWDMGDLVHFLRLFDYRIHSYVGIERIFINNVLFKLNFHIKLVSFKNIDICPIYGSKSFIFGAYAQIWSYNILLIS